MMTSIYSGVSGLKAQQSKLDVIGNNIANINTVGYKGQTVTFADLLSQTISGATAANAATGTGGTNAKQVGTGVSVAATTTNMSTGSTQSTGNSSDVSISGNGFFIVQGGGTSDYQFTRAGNFGVDSSGNLTVNGYKVCGWMNYTTNADGSYEFNTNTQVEPLNLFSDSYNGNKKVCAPQATASATVSGSVDASADAQETQATVGSTANATTNATGLTAKTDGASAFAGDITINGTTITIASGDTVQDVIDKINTVSATTGVTAAWDAGDGTNGYIKLISASYGSDATISLAGDNAVLTGLFAATTDTSVATVSAAGTGYDSSNPDATTTLTVYDSLGNSYDVEVNLYKCYVSTDSSGNAITTWRWEAAPSDSGLSLSNNRET